MLFYVFGLVLVLVCGGGILGFVLAIYVFRPQHLADLLSVMNSSSYENHEQRTAVVVVGLAIAALLPALAGLSYVVSGTRLFVEFFGVAGTYFWGWVAGAFALGFLLGLILRSEVRN